MAVRSRRNRQIDLVVRLPPHSMRCPINFFKVAPVIFGFDLEGTVADLVAISTNSRICRFTHPH